MIINHTHTHNAITFFFLVVVLFVWGVLLGVFFGGKRGLGGVVFVCFFVDLFGGVLSCFVFLC